jgi:hypothetical protein
MKRELGFSDQTILRKHFIRSIELFSKYFIFEIVEDGKRTTSLETD